MSPDGGVNTIEQVNRAISHSHDHNGKLRLLFAPEDFHGNKKFTIVRQDEIGAATMVGEFVTSPDDFDQLLEMYSSLQEPSING